MANADKVQVIKVFPQTLSSGEIKITGDVGFLQGLSAYQIAVNNGFQGSVNDWIDSLKGKKGDAFTYEDFTPEELEVLKGRVDEETEAEINSFIQKKLNDIDTEFNQQMRTYNSAFAQKTQEFDNEFDAKTAGYDSDVEHKLSDIDDRFNRLRIGYDSQIETVANKLEQDATNGRFDGKDGEPFKYEDFTAEQLAALKGEPGDDYILTESDKEEIASKVHVEENHITEYVENPYNDSELREKISVVETGKVDKVSGKSLSTNDYDNDAKSKVDAIPADPKYTDTVYDDTDIKNDISVLNEEYKELQGSVNEISVDVNKLKIKDAYYRKTLREAIHHQKKKYSIPSELSDIPIIIYDDGANFSTDFSVEDYKNIGGNTYYCSTNGLVGQSGLDRNNPTILWKALTRTDAYQIKDGDTIVLLDGVHCPIGQLNSSTQKTNIPKNINIVADNNGKAIISSASDSSVNYTLSSGYMYVATRSNTLKVVQYDENYVVTPLVKVNTEAECLNTKGTFFINGTSVYVHRTDDSAPNQGNTLCLLNYGIPILDVNSASQNINLYLEGIKFVGGTPCTVRFRDNTGIHKDSVISAKECEFLCAYDSTCNFDAISILGAKYAFFDKCKAMYSSKDGFNYHTNGVTIPKFIELNCIGSNNGVDGFAESQNKPQQNGSTAHDGVKGIRINGIYANNYGGNVTDVNDGTVTLNLGCYAFDSAYNQVGFGGDFEAQSADVVMYLDRCLSFGSKTSLLCATNGHLFVRNSDYDATKVSGTISEF